MYSAVLLTTGNDVIPYGNFQIAFGGVVLLIGAVIEANIFGNMALIIGDLNQSSADFQDQLDTANTVMKSLRLPWDIQNKVVSYLNYMHIPLKQQEEMNSFY